MKKFLVLAGIILSFACKAQVGFTTTDSLRRYNNRYINNSAVEAFQNKRLNTLLHGIINQIDSSKAGTGGAVGVDTLYAINDSTVRYKKNGVSYNKVFKGVYDSRRKVDSLFKYNDSILGFNINGSPHYVVLPGRRVAKLNDSAIVIDRDTIQFGSGQGLTTAQRLKLKDSVIISVNNIAALRALPWSTYSTGTTIQVNGYYTPGDGGGGRFKYDATGGGNGDDGGSAIIPTGASAQAFIRDDNATRPYYANAKEFGLIADGATNNTTLFNKMIGGRIFQFADYYKYPIDIYLPAGTYLLTPGSVNSLQTSITIHGDAGGSTIIKFTGNGTLFQPGNANQSFYFHDLTIDFNGYSGTAFDMSNGVAKSVEANKITFLNLKGTGITVAGDNARFTDLSFYHNQDFDSLSTSTDIRGVRGSGGYIGRCYSYYGDAGFNIGAGSIGAPVIMQNASNWTIENNTLISWYFLRPVRDPALQGAASYIHYGHTSPDAVFCRQALVAPGKNFSSYHIPINTTVRIVDTVFHSTANITFGAGTINSGSYNFGSYGFKEGDYVLIKDYTHSINVFATIKTDTINHNTVYFANPLDATTYQPVTFPLSGTASYDVSVMRVVGKASIADISGDTLFVGYFTDLNGDSSLPAPGKPFAVLMNHGSHGIMLNPSAANAFVSNNVLIGGWADQINPYAPGCTVINNYVAWGQDVGITHEGDHGDISHNTVRKQGATGIYSGQRAGSSRFIGNDVRDVQTVNRGADALLSAYAIGGNGNIFADNQGRIETNVSMNYGLTIFGGDSNAIHNNQMRANLFDIRLQDFEGDICRRNIIENNLGYSTFINSPDNYITGTRHNLADLPSPDSLYSGKIMQINQGLSIGNYLEVLDGAAYVWKKIATKDDIDAIAAPVFDQTTIAGAGTVGNEYHADTTTYIATKYDIAHLHGRLDSLINDLPSGPGGGITSVAHDATLTGLGTGASPLKVDTSANKIATKWDLTQLPGLVPQDPVTAGSGISVSGGSGFPYVVSASGSAGSNPGKWISVETYGAVANAVVVAGRDTSSGLSDLAPSLNAAFAAAADGQVVVVPPGSWTMHSALDTIRNKRINLIIYGTIYCNKRTFIRIYPATTGSPYKQHDIRLYGELIGAANLPIHDKTSTTHTGPVWANLTGAGIEVRNGFRNHFEINKITGFYYGIDNQVDNTGGFGGQENTFSVQMIDACSVNFAARSMTTGTYWDKNTLTGINGGTCRLSGGMGILFQGFGATYEGAFRSNKFQNVLVERIDTAVRFRGDITETFFDHFMVEAGTYTGIHTDYVFEMRNVAPNFVRGTTFIASEFIYQRWLTNATFGVRGKIVNTPFYTANSTYIGQDAIIDDNGNLVIEKAAGLSLAVITGLPSYVKVVNLSAGLQEDVTISSSTYTIGAGVATVKYNYAGGLATLPAASTNVKRVLAITNITSGGGAGNISVSNLTYGDNVIKPGTTGNFKSDGTYWTRMDDGNSGTGSSSVSASNGLSSSGSNVTLGGSTLTQNTSIPGAGFNLSLGTGGSRLGTIGLTGTYVSMRGRQQIFWEQTYGNVDFDINAAPYNATSFFTLANLTASHTITFSGTLTGEVVYIYNGNTSGFTYNVSGSVKGPTGTAITALQNGYSYKFIYNGSSWTQY